MVSSKHGLKGRSSVVRHEELTAVRILQAPPHSGIFNDVAASRGQLLSLETNDIDCLRV